MMTGGAQRGRSASLTNMTSLPKLIPNELLAYAFGATTRHSKEDVRSAILGFYPPGEILAAKKTLWETFAAKLPPLQKRRDTDLRPVYEAELDDLMNGVYCLDEKRDADDAEFVVRDIYNLPPLIHVDSPSSRLQVIENVVKEMCHMMHQQHFPPPTQNPPPECTSCDTLPKVSYSEAAQPNCSNECDDDEYMLVSHKNKKKMKPTSPTATGPRAQPLQRAPAAPATMSTRSSQAPRQQQRRVLTNVGTRKHTAFKAGPQRTDLFVFRVENTVTEDVIREYLTEEKVKVTAMTKVSKENSSTQSFHIAVVCDDPDVLLTDPAFWPDRVCCRRYFTKPRPRRNAATGTENKK